MVRDRRLPEDRHRSEEGQEKLRNAGIKYDATLMPAGRHLRRESPVHVPETDRKGYVARRLVVPKTGDTRG